jgi:hypothetical protein
MPAQNRVLDGLFASVAGETTVFDLPVGEK